MRFLGSGRALTGLLSTLGLFACKGPPPEQVRLELPELVTGSDPIRATVHARRAGASQVTREKLEFSLVPPSLASITKEGNVSCKETGDGKLTVSVQGVKDDEALKCRLVDRLAVAELPLFDLAGSPVVLSARALTKAGGELTDVPVTITTESPRVLAVTGNTLTPHAVGTTTLTVQAGGKSQKLPVRVVKTVKPEALPLEGGHRIYFGLSEGKYEVEVRLLVERKLKIEWRGAPYCTYEGFGRTHRSSCTLQGKGGAVVDNPAFISTGATEVSDTGVSVREIP